MCYLGWSWCCCQLRDEERCTVNWEKHTFVGMFNYWYNTLRLFCFQALSHWCLAVLNNWYQAMASGVIQDCCEKCMEKYDKDGVITVTIYTNVKFKILLYPCWTKLKGGCTCFTLSVCPSVDRIVSALYLPQYSLDPFHIYTSYQATSEGVSPVKFLKWINLKFWQILKLYNLDLGSNMNQ